MGREFLRGYIAYTNKSDSEARLDMKKSYKKDWHYEEDRFHNTVYGIGTRGKKEKLL